jgi:homeobox protein ESX1
MSAMSETDNRGPKASAGGHAPLPPDATAGPGPGQPPPAADQAREAPVKPKEVGGPAGPEPTRYGDCERKGRVSDF